MKNNFVPSQQVESVQPREIAVGYKITNQYSLYSNTPQFVQNSWPSHIHHQEPRQEIYHIQHNQSQALRDNSLRNILNHDEDSHILRHLHSDLDLICEAGAHLARLEKNSSAMMIREDGSPITPVGSTNEPYEKLQGQVSPPPQKMLGPRESFQNGLFVCNDDNGIQRQSYLNHNPSQHMIQQYQPVYSAKPSSQLNNFEPHDQPPGMMNPPTGNKMSLKHITGNIMEDTKELEASTSIYNRWPLVKFSEAKKNPETSRIFYDDLPPEKISQVEPTLEALPTSKIKLEQMRTETKTSRNIVENGENISKRDSFSIKNEEITTIEESISFRNEEKVSLKGKKRLLVKSERRFHTKCEEKISVQNKEKVSMKNEEKFTGKCTEKSSIKRKIEKEQEKMEIDAVSQDGDKSVMKDEPEKKTAEESEDENEEKEEEETRCPCGKTDNAGFMIACEKCGTWQHGRCMGFRRVNDAPQVYYCHVCRPDLVKPTSIAHPEYKEQKALREASRRKHIDILSEIRPPELRRIFSVDFKEKRQTPDSLDHELLFTKYASVFNQFEKDKSSIVIGLSGLTGLSSEKVAKKLDGALAFLRESMFLDPSVSADLKDLKDSREPKEPKELKDIKPSTVSNKTEDINMEDQIETDRRTRNKKKNMKMEYSDKIKTSKKNAQERLDENNMTREQRKMKQVMLQFRRMEEREKKKQRVDENDSPKVEPETSSPDIDDESLEKSRRLKVTRGAEYISSSRFERKKELKRKTSEPESSNNKPISKPALQSFAANSIAISKKRKKLKCSTYELPKDFVKPPGPSVIGSNLVPSQFSCVALVRDGISNISIRPFRPHFSLQGAFGKKAYFLRDEEKKLFPLKKKLRGGMIDLLNKRNAEKRARKEIEGRGTEKVEVDESEPLDVKLDTFSDDEDLDDEEEEDDEIDDGDEDDEDEDQEYEENNDVNPPTASSGNFNGLALTPSISEAIAVEGEKQNNRNSSENRTLTVSKETEKDLKATVTTPLKSGADNDKSLKTLAASPSELLSKRLNNFLENQTQGQLEHNKPKSKNAEGSEYKPAQLSPVGWNYSRPNQARFEIAAGSFPVQNGYGNYGVTNGHKQNKHFKGHSFQHHHVLSPAHRSRPQISINNNFRMDEQHLDNRPFKHMQNRFSKSGGFWEGHRQHWGANLKPERNSSDE